MSVRLNNSALGHVLKGAEVRRMVTRKAQEVADHVTAQNVEVGAFKGGNGPISLPARVTTEVTDRVVAFVVLAHPAGIAAQAKYGVLTKAASSAGLHVN